MIISHEHKFIFLKPFKVAGSSFEFALSSILGPSDVLTYLGPDEEKQRWKAFKIKEQRNRKSLADLIKNFTKQDKRHLKSLRWPKVLNPHATAEEVAAVCPQTVWDEYIKISLVRNPWDYLLSFYYWNPSGIKRKPFAEWMFDNRHLIGMNNHQYFINRDCVIDCFIRYEHMMTDVDNMPLPVEKIFAIKKHLSVTNFKSGFRKKNKIKEARLLEEASFIDPIIYTWCDFEIQTFGYARPS